MKKQLLSLLLLTVLGFSVTYAQNYPEMIAVEGGTFTMGDTEMDGQSDELPTHEVTLKSFKIAKTETTVAQWKTFCTATGRKMPETPSWGWIDSHPMVNINYNDAIEYCDWLAAKMKANYRLPTEAEWEFAASGGKLSKRNKYSGGRSMDNLGWYSANSGGITHEVAKKSPNELGIYDMSGNAWEWCKDWYGVYNASPQTDPKGKTEGFNRVLRGGSCTFVAAHSRVVNRNFAPPSTRHDNNGFRVLLSK